MHFSCPGCGRRITADELWAGRPFPCPYCGHTTLAPTFTAAGSAGLSPALSIIHRLLAAGIWAFALAAFGAVLWALFATL